MDGAGVVEVLKSFMVWPFLVSKIGNVFSITHYKNFQNLEKHHRVTAEVLVSVCRLAILGGTPVGTPAMPILSSNIFRPHS